MTLTLSQATVEEYTMHAGMSPFEMQDILLPSGTNGVKDLHISVSHSSSLALFASLGKKLSVLSLDSGNLVVNYDLQFNRGTSAMQHYVATRPMFIDVEIMNADTKLVLGDLAGQASPSNVARGLSSLYKEITDTVHKEAATITAVFPSPSEVMSILVQSNCYVAMRDFFEDQAAEQFYSDLRDLTQRVIKFGVSDSAVFLPQLIASITAIIQLAEVIGEFGQPLTRGTGETSAIGDLSSTGLASLTGELS
ncbi:Exocyst complex component SEC10a isoform B [Glycine soja]|uniref:Exocyst complex component SEC10a isoform B n=1 Tax=Glycine soja TaxID=3848 RepID=A0A445JXJ4_GLYSO|nr:Exocyst complex component SEC10a isoform B [Glycine soja]